MLRLFRLDLAVEVEAISEPELRSRIEAGLNMSCHYLEADLKPKSISYKIKETLDLD